MASHSDSLHLRHASSSHNLCPLPPFITFGTNIHPSIHPASSTYLGLGRGGSCLSRDTQTSLSLDTSSTSSERIPRRSQASQVTQSLQRVLVLPQGLLSVGHARNTSRGRCPGVQVYRCPSHLSWLLLMCSKLLLGDRAPHPISKGAARHPARKLILAACIWDLILLVMTQSL